MVSFEALCVGQSYVPILKHVFIIFQAIFEYKTIALMNVIYIFDSHREGILNVQLRLPIIKNTIQTSRSTYFRIEFHVLFGIVIFVLKLFIYICI